jgi:hypothetical protein
MLSSITGIVILPITMPGMLSLTYYITGTVIKKGLIVRSRHFQPFLISEHHPFFTTAINKHHNRVF